MQVGHRTILPKGTSSPGDTPTLQTLAMMVRASETLNDAARPRTKSVYVFTSGLGHFHTSPTSLSLTPALKLDRMALKTDSAKSALFLSSADEIIEQQSEVLMAPPLLLVISPNTSSASLASFAAETLLIINS